MAVPVVGCAAVVVLMVVALPEGRLEVQERPKVSWALQTWYSIASAEAERRRQWQVRQ